MGQGVGQVTTCIGKERENKNNQVFLYSHNEVLEGYPRNKTNNYLRGRGTRWVEEGTEQRDLS